MGADLHCCAGEESKTKAEYDKIFKQNQTLKKKLLTEQTKNVELENTHKQAQDKNIKELADMNRSTVPKRKYDDLKTKLIKTNQRMSKIEENNSLLKKQNKELKNVVQTSDQNDAINRFDTIQAVANEPDIAIDIDIKSSDSLLDPIDPSADPRSDCTKLRNWLVYRNLNDKELKNEISKLLTARNESHRSKIPIAYSQRYSSTLIDDVSKKLKKGKSFQLIEGLLLTSSAYDAICFRELISTKSIVDISQILCCRNTNELQLISHEYKKLYNDDLKDKILNLSSKKTLNTITEYLLTFQRNNNYTLSINDDTVKKQIVNDISYFCDNNIKFKKSVPDKKKLAIIIVGNNNEYIRELNKQFFIKSNNSKNLIDFIDDQLGKNSSAGNWLKQKIEFSEDMYDYYARRINMNLKTDEINKIFIRRFGNDLKQIENKFNEMNYGNGKDLKQWIQTKCPGGTQYKLFLTRMLDNCSRI